MPFEHEIRAGAPAIRIRRSAVRAAVVVVAAAGAYASGSAAADAAPRVAIDAPPKTLARVGGTVPLHVRSRDADRIIMRVDGKRLAGWRTSKRTVRWNTRKTRAGVRVITVTATDRSGRERTVRRALRVDQRRATGAPRLTVGLRGHRASIPGPIRVTARPLTRAGIHRVEWRVDGRRVATVRKRPFVWTWKKPTAGRHRITVRAIDTAGRRRTVGRTIVVPQAIDVPHPGRVTGTPAPMAAGAPGGAAPSTPGPGASTPPPTATPPPPTTPPLPSNTPSANAPVFVLFNGATQSVGSPGITQDVVNVVGNVSDPDGVASLTYSLNGGPQRALSRGPDNRRLEYPGDFNAEVPVAELGSGANEVVLRATDTTGAVAQTTVTVNHTMGATWPLPYTLDWATKAADAQVVDGKWSFSAAGARSDTLGYDRLIAIGDRAWSDYEVRVPVTVHSVDTANGYPYPSNGPLVGLGLRWQGHTQTDAEQPCIGYFPAGAYAWYRWRPDGTERFELDTQNTLHMDRVTNPAQIQVGTQYMMVMRVTTQPDGHGRYQFRMWPADQPEPTTWTVQNDAVMDLKSGSALLIAHHIDATFGDVTVTPL